MNQTFTRISSGIVLVFLLLNGWGIAQAKIPADDERQLTEVLSEISERYQVIITYDAGTLDGIKVDYKAKEFPSDLESALKMVMKQTNLEYKSISAKYYVVYRDDFRGRRDIRKLERKMRQIQKIESSGNISLGRKQAKENLQFSEILESARMLTLDNIEVSGTVTDEEGEPLIGVNIQVKGTTKGTSTDFDGIFTLDDVDENAVLVISYVGYQTQEVSVDGKSSLEIVMLSDSQLLDEVVVVGYGTQKKSDLTGAIGVIGMDEDMISRPSTDIGQKLYGKISGVNVIRGSARPGSSPTIQIRGINSITAGAEPLIIVDGVQLPEYDLNTINSSDIETIQVLKDASAAAIYGSRGANGVVIITTKAGFSGKPSLNLNYSYSLQRLGRKIDVMDSKEYAAASIDAAQNGWIASGGDPNAPNTIETRGDIKFTWPVALENPEKLPNTDWQDLIFRVAPMHNVDLSLTGGDDKTQYYISGGFVEQEGIIITSDYNKYNLNLKLSSSINERIALGGGLNYLYDNEREPFYRITEWAVQYPSIYPVYGTDGYLGSPNNMEVDGFSPYYGILFRPYNGHPLYEINRVIRHKRFTTIGNIFLDIKILDGLDFRTSFNAFNKRRDNSEYAAQDHQLGPSNFTTAFANATMDRIMSFNWDNVLSYRLNIEKHYFDMIAGYEYYSSEVYGITSERRRFNNDDYQYIAAGETIFGANDHASENTLISYLTRLNYNYDNRFLVTASFRRDGSSRFGPNNKWGNFPSLALAWNITNEPFMESLINIISLAKLRGSYGLSGNDQFGDYRWMTRMTQSRASVGNNLLITYSPSNIQNADLAWERTRQFNFGLDLGFLNNRISLDAELYLTRSSSLLLDVPIPSTSGFSTVFRNIGQVDNNGFEFNVTSRNLVNMFRWTTQLNFSINKNKVVSLGENNASMIFNTNSFGGMERINQVGKPIFGFYGYKFDGVYKNQAEIEADPAAYPNATPGDGRYLDVNGDGVINSSDRTIIGNYQPDLVFGIGNEFAYKNLSISILFQGVLGSDIYDDDGHRFLLYHEGRNYSAELVNRWRSEDNPGDGYYPKLTSGVEGFQKTPSSFWIVNGDYLRLKSLTLGYNLTSKLLSKYNIMSARLFFNGENLLLFNKSNIYDPESFIRASGEFSDPLARGISGTGYPAASIFTFGLNLGF